jgi:hypothetical protein
VPFHFSFSIFHFPFFIFHFSFPARAAHRPQSMTSRDLLPDYLQHGTPTDPTDPDPRLVDSKRGCWMPRDADYGRFVRIVNEEHQRLLAAGLPNPFYDFKMSGAKFFDRMTEETYPRQQKVDTLRSGEWTY